MLFSTPVHLLLAFVALVGMVWCLCFLVVSVCSKLVAPPANDGPTISVHNNNATSPILTKPTTPTNKMPKKLPAKPAAFFWDGRPIPLVTRRLFELENTLKIALSLAEHAASGPPIVNDHADVKYFYEDITDELQAHLNLALRLAAAATVEVNEM